MKVVVTVQLKSLINDLQQAFPKVEFIEHRPSELCAEDYNADILIGTDARIDFSQFTQLKWVMWYSAGVNQLPLEQFKARNIILTNARGVHKIQIAEFIFAYIMADYKHLYEFHQLQEDRGFRTAIRNDELYEKTICFLGTGEIAGNAARLAQAFTMKTIGINTNGRAVDHFDETYSIDERTSAFKAAHIIVNVLPETEETIQLLKRHDFEAMGREALFINVGRGTIVEEEVLVDVLELGVIRKAALDVYYEEPLNEDNKLYQLDNVIMTPHITGLSSRYNERATAIFMHNLEHFNAKEQWLNIVDYEKGY